MDAVFQDNPPFSTFDALDSSPLRKSPPPRQTSRWSAAGKKLDSVPEDETVPPKVSSQTAKDVKLRLSFDMDSSDVGEPSSPVSEVDTGTLRRSARNAPRATKGSNSSIKGWKSIGSPKHKKDDKAAQPGMSYPVDKLPKTAVQDPSFFIKADNKIHYNDFFNSLDHQAKRVENTLAQLKAEVESEFVDRAEDHDAVLATSRSGVAGGMVTPRRSGRHRGDRRYSDHAIVYAEPLDMLTQQSQGTQKSKEDKHMKKDIESAEVDRRKKKLTCTTATKKDALRLKHQAMALMKYPESQTIHAEMIIRFQRMFFVQAETAEMEGHDPPSLVKIASELQAFMHHTRSGRIMTGELANIIDHEIEWADWIYETCQTGVMHIDSEYCDCKTEWDATI